MYWQTIDNHHWVSSGRVEKFGTLKMKQKKKKEQSLISTGSHRNAHINGLQQFISVRPIYVCLV